MATLPIYQPPNYRELPGYHAPVYDDAEVDTLTQKRAAPGLRALRQTISRIGASGGGNSDMKRMTLRDALQGYGTGISKVIGESSKAATNEYGKKYGFAITNAQSEYGAAAARASAYNENARDTAKTLYGGSLKEYETETEKEMMEKKYELEDRYNGDNDWAARMDKEYDLWKQRYDYTQTNPPAAPTVPDRWTPLGRA